MNKLTRKPHTPTLSLWTVYDHPSDYPCHFVARRFDIAGGCNSFIEIYLNICNTFHYGEISKHR